MTQQQQPHSPALARLVLVMMVIALAGGLTAGILALAGSYPHSPLPPSNHAWTEQEEECIEEHDMEYNGCYRTHCEWKENLEPREPYEECVNRCIKEAGC